MSDQPEMVNHPKHYNSHPSGVECIDIIEWLPFNPGNAVKYLWRKDDKINHDEDVRKALWYTEREVLRRNEVYPINCMTILPTKVCEDFDRWLRHEPEGWRKEAIHCLVTGYDASLEEAVEILKAALAEFRKETESEIHKLHTLLAHGGADYE